MASEQFDLELTGCHAEPLASYLKALGILRLIAEQRDADARGFWRGEHFVLRSTLNRSALLRFFAEEWQPTPVVAPWNGGSGFYPKDNHAPADAIVAADSPRLRVFAESIGTARKFIDARGWTERPKDDDKLLMLSVMRSTLPDEALAWLDAAVVIGDARMLFPPLLGSGGNDGHLEFSINFQRRVLEVFAATSGPALESCLFGTALPSRFKGPMGQYQPSANACTNPWDFVLLIEGALVFAAAATRRYETASPVTLAFPFHARAGGGIGTVVDHDEAEGRDELWLPLWSAATTAREVRRLFSEGRATVGSGDRTRAAASALDFARAVTALGVDRGIEGFARFGFYERNGRNHYATPLGRFETREVRAVRLFDDVDAWYDRFRYKTSGKNVPIRLALSRRRLEQAMFDALVTGEVGPVLLDLGRAEWALAQSLAFTTKNFLMPLPQLQAAWATEAEDGSTEQRLAAALASRPAFRRRLLPLDRGGAGFGRPDEPDFVFTERPLVENLHALLRRESVEASQQAVDRPPLEAPQRFCSLTDIARFIRGETNDVLLDLWLRALAAVDTQRECKVPLDGLLPPAAFAVIALVHHRRVRGDELPRTSGVLGRACAGDARGATALAIQRLNATENPLPITAIAESGSRMRRIAAALAFPLTRAQSRLLERMVLASHDDDTTPASIGRDQENI